MRNQSGFTLIELVTVIAIIIFLAGITIGVGKYMVDRSASKAAQAQLATLNRALDRYAADNMRYPDKHPSLVNLFPPDTDPATFTALYGLPLSRISSQYTNGKLEYYKASVSEVDVNGDGEVTIEDRFEDELFILDPWGLPIFYYVEEKTVLNRQVFFGFRNPNGCDLGSRGPNGIADSHEGGKLLGGGDTDDIVNWR